MSAGQSFNSAGGSSLTAIPAFPVTLHNVVLDDIVKKEALGRSLYRIGAQITDMSAQTPATERAFFLNKPVYIDIYYKPDSLKDYSTPLFKNPILKPIELSEVKFTGNVLGRPLGLMGPEKLSGVLLKVDPGTVCVAGPNNKVTGTIVDIHRNWNKMNETVFNATDLKITVETPLKRDQIKDFVFFDNIVLSPPDSNGLLQAKEKREVTMMPDSPAYKDRLWKAVQDLSCS